MSALLPRPRRPLLPARLRIWSGAAASEQAWLAEHAAREPADIEAFLAQSPPNLLRHTHYLAMLLLAALVLLASVLQVDVIVAGSGRLVADAPTVVVQPMQLSIIRDIRVKPGDTVRRGDVLATLDPTFARADWSALDTRRVALHAEIARLEAELSGQAFDGGEDDLQRTLLAQRRAQYAARLADFDQKLDGAAADIAAAEQSRQSLGQQFAVAQELQAMRAALYDAKAGSKLNYLAAQVDRMRAERDLQDAATHLSELRHAARSTQADRQAFIDDWRRDLLEHLVRARAEAVSVAENLAKARRLNDLVQLTAPEDAVVLEVAKRSVGSVLREAEPLVTLVPADAALIADIAISSADVGYAKPGDSAVVKIDAFPYQRHGTLPGHLRSIAEDSAPPSGAAAAPALYHRSQVTLDSTALHAMPPGARPIPGMTVTAEIEVGSRSVISYFLYPILRSLHESLREP